MATAATRQPPAPPLPWRPGEGVEAGRIALPLAALAVIVRGRKRRRSTNVRCEPAGEPGTLVLSQAGRTPVGLVADAGGVRVLAAASANRDGVRQFLREAFGWLVEVDPPEA